MPKGRKPSKVVAEAREVVNNGQFEAVISDLQVSQEVKNRIVKAVKLGLGIKEVKVVETVEEIQTEEKGE